MTNGDKRETKHTNDVAFEALDPEALAHRLIERPYLAHDGEPTLFVSWCARSTTVIARAGRHAGIARPIDAYLLR